MHSLDDSCAIFRYHRDMAALHGADSSLALGWRNMSDQQVRFEALAEIADLNGKTVLDAGCGYGDLFPYLTSHNDLAHYYGVEQIPEILDIAIGRYGHLSNTTFISRNFLRGGLPSADYILSSGSLNYGSSDPGFIFNAITALFDHAVSGLGFNLLLSIPDNGLLVAYDPELILAHCRSLTSKVVLKADYAAEDFTLFLYH